ncbi:DOUBLE-STRANDED RNA-BINDING PROTEIN 1 [Salix koriyanagi]|uniref:DOUBLE-STRANDED RNA-BINDING PROTEIN 1 n=1 Tax=Salix koriyanagi TaxID=2511006 RepID=A0A9Q0TDK4_9ROSI|nr:DOUBLE-STRANDED RNA-BINDING PROTEIN 1 [Salix koriyanagi]
MLTSEGSSGVSNCYVFKSRLQEYAQKTGLPTPVYETIKEGPSHEPFFRSTVIVKDVRYDSLPGFFNRKAAEQSAAEVALVQLARDGEINESTSQPVNETGLCKNLLQEYAQKMNYAIPLYECQKDETPARGHVFKCTVEIGGIRYIGASAKSKKEAEIKAARTALLAIQLSGSDKQSGNSQLTVIPCRKRGVEASFQEVENAPKPKKTRFKKKMLKNKLFRDRINNARSELTEKPDIVNGQSGSELDQTDKSAIQGANCKVLTMETTMTFQDGKSGTSLNERETFDIEGVLTSYDAGNPESGQLASPNFNQSNYGTGAEISAKSNAGTGKVTGIIEVASMANNSVLAQIGASNA